MPQDELYSSRIKNFEVFGRQSHPRAEGPDYGSHLNASAWQPLGSFTAANMKGTQVGAIFVPFLLLSRSCNKAQVYREPECYCAVAGARTSLIPQHLILHL